MIKHNFNNKNVLRKIVQKNQKKSIFITKNQAFVQKL